MMDYSDFTMKCLDHVTNADYAFDLSVKLYVRNYEARNREEQAFLTSIMKAHGVNGSAKLDSSYLVLRWKKHEDIYFNIPICILNVDDLYRYYQDTGNTGWDFVDQEIFRQFSGLSTFHLIGSDVLRNYETAKEHFTIMLKSYRNRKSLEGAVYRHVGDIALVACLEMHTDHNTKSACLELRQHNLREYRKTEDDVYQVAIQNTAKLYPPRLVPVTAQGVPTPRYPSSGEFMGEARQDWGDLSDDVLCALTTSPQREGLPTLFYPDVPQQINSLYRNKGFYAAMIDESTFLIHPPSSSPSVVRSSMKLYRLSHPKYISDDVFHFDPTANALYLT